MPLLTIGDKHFKRFKENENPQILANANIDTGTTGVKATITGAANKKRVISDFNVIQISGTPTISIKFSQDGGTNKRTIEKKTISATDFKIQLIGYVPLLDADDQLTIEVDTLSVGNADIVILGEDENET